MINLSLAFLNVPDFAKIYHRHVASEEWGYTAFRTTCYSDPQRWDEFKAKFEKIVRLPFDNVMSGEELQRDRERQVVRDVIGKFGVFWVEDGELEGVGVEGLRKRYHTLASTTPDGQHQKVFLNIDDSVVASVLDTEIPTTGSAWWRETPPFAIVIYEHAESGLEGEDGEDHDEEKYFRPFLRVALEVLADGFWVPIASDMTDYHLIAVNTPRDEVWWSVNLSPERYREKSRRKRPWLYGD